MKNIRKTICVAVIMACFCFMITGAFVSQSVYAASIFNKTTATTTTKAAEETSDDNDPSSVMKGKNIYLFTPYIGFALSNSAARKMFWESKKNGCETSKFCNLYRDGVTVKDENGVAFRVYDGDTPEVESGDCHIYVIDSKIALSELLAGDIHEADFTNIGSVTSEYGTFAVHVR